MFAQLIFKKNKYLFKKNFIFSSTPIVLNYFIIFFYKCIVNMFFWRRKQVASFDDDFQSKINTFRQTTKLT